MDVKCTNNLLWSDILTKYKLYEVKMDDSVNDEYWIEDDNGCFNPFPKYLFTELN